MKISDIKNIKPAKKYASALIKSAQEKNIEADIIDYFKLTLETLNSNKDLKKFLESPLVNHQDKKDVIERIFEPYTSKFYTEFLFLLTDNNRISILKKIYECYIEEYNCCHNIITPVIISAVELEDNQKQKIIEKIGIKLSKTIQPKYIVNKDIIGGIIVEIGDKTIDCSLKTKFENMRKQLIKGNKYGSY